MEIVRILKITPELLALRDAQKNGSADIHTTFKRYEACIYAIAKMRASNENDWPNCEKPAYLDVAAIWVQKTQYKIWDKTFGPILSSYPEMAKWLRNDSDRKSDQEVWTKRYTRYSLKSLGEWLQHQHQVANKSPKKKKTATL